MSASLPGVNSHSALFSPISSGMPPEAAPITWALDLKAKARSRLMVTGLGLDSEWRADLGIAGWRHASRCSGVLTAEG